MNLFIQRITSVRNLVTFLTTTLLFFFVNAQLVLASGHSCEGFGGDGISVCWISLIKPTSIEDLLLAILNIFIVIAVPIIVLFIIYAGFLYVTARGNAQQVEQATRALTYAIIGAVIIIGAVAISEIIKNLVDSIAA